MKYGDLTVLLLKLGARECGVHSSDPKLEKWTPTEIGNQANKLVLVGRLHRAKFAHKNVRFYADKERAEKAVRNHELTKRSPAFGKAKVNATHGTRNPDAPAHLPGEFRYSPDFKFTQCPNYTPRFQSVDLPGLHGGNQRGRVTA